MQHVKNQIERVSDEFSPLWKWRVAEGGKDNNGLSEGENGPRVMSKIKMASRMLIPYRRGYLKLTPNLVACSFSFLFFRPSTEVAPVDGQVYSATDNAKKDSRQFHAWTIRPKLIEHRHDSELEIEDAIRFGN